MAVAGFIVITANDQVLSLTLDRSHGQAGDNYHCQGTACVQSQETRKYPLVVMIQRVESRDLSCLYREDRSDVWEASESIITLIGLLTGGRIKNSKPDVAFKDHQNYPVGLLQETTNSYRNLSMTAC